MIEIKESDSLVIKEHKEELEHLKSYLKKDLSKLNINAAIIFGSATNNELYTEKKSDIDIVAYSKSFSLNKIDYFIKIINEVGGEFLDKSPIFLSDFISPRIEFLYKINDLTFDINIFPSYFYGYKNIETTAAHDSIDIVIGAMYENAVKLFGKSPIEQTIKKHALPFYNNNIRLKRMMQLKDRIIRLNSSIKNKIETDNIDILKELYKSRGYFLKFIFIKNKKYPIDLNNYVEYQLRKYLNYDKNSINILLFKGDSIKDVANKYLNYVDEEIISGGKNE